MSTSTKTERTESQSPVSEGPQVLAIFEADVRATRGAGSVVALCKGGSGKCRLYGRNALARTFVKQEAICKTLTTPALMAEHFGVAVVVGKVACEKFMSTGKHEFEGKEAIKGDRGKANAPRGGSRKHEYATF